MNTPAHMAASLLVWRGESGWGAASAVALGALLPDLPMFGFYAYQKMWQDRPERDIWSELYFQEDWQLFFDVFNSIPLAVILIAVCYFLGFQWGILCAASAMLHMACDLPLHNEDAHCHFLPLTDWHFRSPVSYWDPQRYGRVMALLEMAFSVSACIYVALRGEHFPMRFLAYGTLSLYVLGIAFILVVWVPQLMSSS